MRRRPFDAASTGVAVAIFLTGCGGPSKQPERILGWDRPSASRPAAPVESRVPTPTPATVAVVKAVTASGSTASNGTSPGAPPATAAAAAPAAPAASAPAPAPAPPAPPPVAVAAAPTGTAATRSLAPAPPSLPSTLYFEIDHYRVKPKDHALLQQHAAALKANPDRVLLVRGHADGQGPSDYNRALADKRAETVAKLLASMGADPRQIRHEAAAPSDNGATAKPQREARRVELVYVEMGALAGR